MRIVLIVAALMIAAAPVAAQDRAPGIGGTQYFARTGPTTCYDPVTVTGCPMHCTGGPGSLHCAGENCLNLPWCGSAEAGCDDGSADFFVGAGGGQMAARASIRQQPASRAGMARCDGAPDAVPAKRDRGGR